MVIQDVRICQSTDTSKCANIRISDMRISEYAYVRISEYANLLLTSHTLIKNVQTARHTIQLICYRTYSPLTPNRIAGNMPCDGKRKAFFPNSFALVTDSKS